jgi:adenylate cyclase
MSLLSELKRRNVFRVAAAYLAGAWLLVEVSDTLFSIYGLPGTAARIVATLVAIGFPITLVLSWVYELTPEGLKLEKDIDRAGPVPRSDTRRLDRAIIVLLVLALGYLAVDKFVLEPGRLAEIIEETAQQARSEVLVESYGDQSIAVLPFVNLSADPEQEYFSDGISEELLNLLAKIPELRVISRSSAFYYKGKDVKLADIARELDVAHILEGSVRKAGDRVRITAQLIEARSDTQLWSQNYDRTLDDIFAVQDEIAAAISNALKMEFALVGGKAAQPTAIKTASSAAYDAYLQGRELLLLVNQENLEGAVRQFERAVRLDDSYAPAHAQLAIGTMLLTSHVSSDRERAKRKAIRHLDRAQELEPNLAEAHVGRAVLSNYANDSESAIAHARKALDSNSNNIDALIQLRIAYGKLGRGAEAHAILERILVIDPLSIDSRMDYAEWLFDRRRFEEAHEIAEQLIAQSPQAGYRVHARTSFFGEGKLAEALYWALQTSRDGFAQAWNIFALVGEYDEARRVSAPRIAHWIDASEGRWDVAIQASQREVELSPGAVFFVKDAAEVLYYAGRLDEALPLYERALVLAPEGHGPYFMMNLAIARRKAGDEEGAEAAAQRARQDHAAARMAGERTAGGVDYMEEAMIAAFEHEPDRAFVALQSAIRNGMRWAMFFDAPIFDDLRNEPRFVAIRQELEAILAAEHDKVLQLICFHNPAPDDWQPMPETCETPEPHLRSEKYP